MKTIISPLIISVLILSSCTSSNKIFVQQDVIKKRTTVKLNQSLKGFSDERRKSIFCIPHYYVTFKHYFEAEFDQSQYGQYLIDIDLRTRVRPYELEPVLYILTDQEVLQIPALERITKTYQQGETSTSAETTTSKSEDSDKEGEEVTETSTTYTTTSSHDTFQLMHLRFNPDNKLVQKLTNSDKIRYRLYIDHEMIDIEFRHRDRLKFDKFLKKVGNV